MSGSSATLLSDANVPQRPNVYFITKIIKATVLSQHKKPRTFGKNPGCLAGCSLPGLHLLWKLIEKTLLFPAFRHRFCALSEVVALSPAALPH